MDPALEASEETLKAGALRGSSERKGEQDMKKRMKQMLSGFLALTMTVGGLPTSVLAEELILDEGAGKCSCLRVLAGGGRRR